MTLDFCISSVPSRSVMAKELALQLPEAAIFVDDPPSGGAWNNYRAMLLSGRGSGWIVGLDDDAVLCDDFVNQLERALFSLPAVADFASFYFGNARVVQQARDAKASWIKTLRVVHGICWAVKGCCALEAVDVIDRIVRPGYKPGDQRLLAWLAHTGRSNFASVPSLVDHRQDATSVMANTFGEPNKGVRAAYFEKDASKIVWSSTSYAHRDAKWIAVEKLSEDGAFV